MFDTSVLSPETGLSALPAEISRVWKLLRSTFGQTFQLWDGSALSPHLLLGSPDLETTALVNGNNTFEWPARLAKQLVEERQVIVEKHANEQFRVSIHLPTAEGTWLATAIVPSPNAKWPDRLARSFCRERQSEVALERAQAGKSSLILQITRCFEELSLVRHVATQLQICDASRDMNHLAELILPDLRRTIRARSLALLSTNRSHPSQSFSGYHAVHADTCPAFRRDTAEHVVRQFAEQAHEQPFVTNQGVTLAGGVLPFTLDSVIVVCVRSGQGVAGWLIAANPIDSEQDGILLNDECDELVFGTFETGMMETVASFLASQARNASLLTDVKNVNISAIRVLVSTIEAKDQYTKGHSERVATFAQIIASKCGRNQEYRKRIFLCGLVHDIGKIGVPDAILRKPGKLTDEEFAYIKRHPEDGCRILRQLDQLNHVLDGVLYHHERYDGGGYPRGLAGEAIPFDGRLIAVADAYDAMASDRPYRKGIPQDEVEKILEQGAGKQWDPQIIKAALQTMSQILQARKNWAPNLDSTAKT